MTRTDPALGLHSLATMARLLGPPAPLSQVLEVAAEGSRVLLGAASVSIGRVDAGVLRTIINVGDLADWEERWPEDEVYAVLPWQELAQVLEYGTTRTDALEDPHCDPRERELLQRLGKGSSLTAAIVVEGRHWGEFYATRHVGWEPFNDRAIDYVDILLAILANAIAGAKVEP